MVFSPQVFGLHPAGKKFVPDEFFDATVESEKEFCDVSMTLIKQRGLEGINSISV